MRSWTDDLRFAFQPVVGLRTGGVAALEILARPETGDILAEARRDAELDGMLAVSAIRAAARKETLLPLHVNVFAGTLADLGGLTPLHDAVREAGRLPWEVTLDVCPPYTHVPQQALLEAVAALRAQGFRICADGVGDGDVPLRLLTDLAPELVKLDASLLARPSAVRAMRTLCDGVGRCWPWRAWRPSCSARPRGRPGRSWHRANCSRRRPGCPPRTCTFRPAPPGSCRRRARGRRCGSSSGRPHCCPRRPPPGRYGRC